MRNVYDDVDNLKIKKKYFDYRVFSNLDDSDDQSYMLSASEEMNRLTHIKEIKRIAVEKLNLVKGDTVIEVGCGSGESANFIAEQVGDLGQVVAIDISNKMINEARLRFSFPNLEFQVGNANHLSFPDNSFCACYAERLLISQPDPDKIAKEMVRVLKNGGRLCITDLDFGTIFIYPSLGRLTDILIRRLQAIVENKHIGRNLPSIFRKAGLKDTHLSINSYFITSFEHVVKMVDFPRIIADLVDMGEYTQVESEKVLRSFQAADESGDFLYGLSLFTLVGTK